MPATIISMPFLNEEPELALNSEHKTEEMSLEDIILRLAVNFDQLSLMVKHSGIISILPRLPDLIKLTKQAGFSKQTILLKELIQTIKIGEETASHAIFARAERRSEVECLAALSEFSISGQ